jgi:peroxiredoxin
MSISTGDRVPDVPLFDLDDAGAPRALSAAERFAGKRVLVFAVPGAFTRTCSAKHLPGFVASADAIKARGVAEIACVSVNDAMVMAAWGREHGAEGKVTMLADGLGAFARAMGLEQDMSDRGYGVRSQRYAMVVDDGTVTELQVEPPGGYGVSSAEAMLERLG